MKNIYAILDIGSATLKFLVAEAITLMPMYYLSKQFPSHGVKKELLKMTVS